VIERVRVVGYRKFRELNFEPHQRLNILVGDNDAGKSTLLEAITLALTGQWATRQRRGQSLLVQHPGGQGVLRRQI
jgi:predicted ATP-dependent endonuclease of OLD family